MKQHIKLTDQNTSFKCKICDQIVIFNVNDPKTYFNKGIPETFFGSSLTVYRVSHSFKDIAGNLEEHINAVSIDQDNKYRAHKDFYKINVNEIKETQKFSYFFINGINNNSQRSNLYKLFLIFNREEHWAVDCYHDMHIDLPNFIKVLDDKIIEAMKIYNTLQENILINLADQIYHLYRNNDVFLCILLNDQNLMYSQLEPFFINLINYYANNKKIIPNRDSIFTTIQALENNNQINTQYLFDIITDDIFDYSFLPNSQIKFTEILKLVDMIYNRPDIKISIDKENFINLLNGNITLKDILVLYPQKYIELCDILNFLRSRKIISIKKDV